jgi:ABC-type multidrug transport system permease subunit
MVTQEEIIARLVGAFFCAVITGMLANYKNRSVIGWGIFGFFTFIIAFVILLLLGKKKDPSVEQPKQYVD